MPSLSPIAPLCTGDETLDDVFLDARSSGLSIGGEPIAFDLPIIAKGGVAALRTCLRNDIADARSASWGQAHGFDKDGLAERYRQIAWYTWRAYRAAMREKCPS
jgi:hypothetical protein